MTCQEQADAALLKLKALQTLTHTTGTITNKAQREVLRSLAPDVMVIVAEQLYRTNDPILSMNSNPNKETDRDRTFNR